MNQESSYSKGVARLRRGDLVDTTGLVTLVLGLFVISTLFFSIRLHVLDLQREHPEFYGKTTRTKRAVAHAEAILSFSSEVNSGKEFFW